MRRSPPTHRSASLAASLLDTRIIRVSVSMWCSSSVSRPRSALDERANTDQDPYFIHFYRVNFDGSGLVALTEGNGNHSVQYSPDRKYIIDTYSRVDNAAGA